MPRSPTPARPATSASSSSASTACWATAPAAACSSALRLPTATRSAAWQQLAGDIPVAWALTHREEVQAASRLRHDVDALGALSDTVPEVDEDLTSDLVHVLVSRLAAARSVGGEGVPIILDDPFREVEASVKPLLLELIGRAAGRPQVVFLTEDEDVASWARLEALTGEVALVEPDASGDEATPRRVRGGGMGRPAAPTSAPA